MDSSVDEQQQYSSFPDFQHLNIDLCLELICPYLDLSDLSSVADTCMQMRSAAELTFAHKYRKQFICIRDSEAGFSQCRIYSLDRILAKAIGFDSKIVISKPKTCFRVLRCFGQMISKLCCVECPSSTGALWCNLEKYVAKHCASYITQLEIWNRRTSFVNLEAVFPNVEKLSLIYCNLNKTTTEFNKRFPQMRSLDFIAASTMGVITAVADQRCIVDHFPNLEHLSLDFSSERIENTFHEETVLNALDLNPKLRSLSLVSNYDEISQEFIQQVSRKCELLGALQLNGPSLRFSDVIHFENLKYFRYSNFGGLLCSPILLTFNALETFECSNHNSEALSFIFEFVRRNPSISKMKFTTSSNCLTHDKITEMKNAFAFVKELEINIFVVHSSAGEISFLVKCLKSIHKLTLKHSIRYNFEYLLASMKYLSGIPWTIDEKNKTIEYNKVN